MDCKRNFGQVQCYRIIELDEEKVLEEIARIASGKITEVSINHARELRNQNLKTA